MTPNITQETGEPRRARQRAGRIPPLSLRHKVPADWHQDRPAFAGDPLMDWESVPESPKEPQLERFLGRFLNATH